ncbi:peptide/nickel transport system ATP-binding protein [Arboricoccus pini]|uniref:Peptide/nickel transport system ATP-binding protein n=1 Tax=Arboricoccus pini TaxID=1963835 RepID=A0A212RRW5_9PROT|nr:ABC transporter ATP-binding protein [Arboricoccus pini]SNB75399.1 peptide/nickel transport system ATP-binding protein [Arboricoccus pini]
MKAGLMRATHPAEAAAAHGVPLLEVDRLTLDFATRGGRVKALDQVGFTLDRGQILGLVGESGSGKSVTAFAIMDLLDQAARIETGQIRFTGIDLLARKRRALKELRGREIAMIFQSPRTALHPIRKVGHQIEDVLRAHSSVPPGLRRQKAIEALERVRIPDPARRYEAYPFELSGGMCQRVMIAMALSADPSLLIADEPTTGLDVTTQAVIMDLIRDLVRESGMSVLLITHDLAMAGEYCDRIAVMHAGHIVETAPAHLLLREPAHPYSAKLIAATPAKAASIEALAAIPGNLPDLRQPQPPCRFSTRCERHRPDCDQPPLDAARLGQDHLVLCRHPL